MSVNALFQLMGLNTLLQNVHLSFRQKIDIFTLDI